jgi:hypothetical protein
MNTQLWLGILVIIVLVGLMCPDYSYNMIGGADTPMGKGQVIRPIQNPNNRLAKRLSANTPPLPSSSDKITISSVQNPANFSRRYDRSLQNPPINTGLVINKPPIDTSSASNKPPLQNTSYITNIPDPSITDYGISSPSSMPYNIDVPREGLDGLAPPPVPLEKIVGAVTSVIPSVLENMEKYGCKMICDKNGCKLICDK